MTTTQSTDADLPPLPEPADIVEPPSNLMRRYVWFCLAMIACAVNVVGWTTYFLWKGLS